MRALVTMAALVVLAPTAAAGALLPVQRDPAALEAALEAELQRALGELVLPDQERPYLVIYDVVDGSHATYHASLGSLLSADEEPHRQLRAEVRVGGYGFDSSNFDALGEPDGVVVYTLPLEDDIHALRRQIWLATDVAYKQAVEQYSRKRAELEPADQELPDLLPAEPVKTGPLAPVAPDGAAMREIAERLSGVMRDYPTLESGEAATRDWEGVRLTYSSEGFRLYRDTGYAVVRAEAVLRLEDGSRLRDGRWWVARTPGELPELAEMEAEVREMCDWLVALADAPVLEDYIGPVLFEAPAAVELYRQLAAPELVGTPPMKQSMMLGDLGGTTRTRARVGRRLMPEGWTVTDDPTREGTAGSYVYDHDGVPARPVQVVHDGVVRELLMSRVPAGPDQPSTGHARAMGGERRAAMPAVVAVVPRRVRSERRMKRRALRLAAQTGQDAVLVMRRLEPPAMTEDFDVFFTGEGPPPGLTPPYEAYLLYPDGREQPVRGAVFSGVDRRVLRETIMAGEPGPFVGVMDASPGPRRFNIGAVGGLPAAWSVPPVLLTEIEMYGDSGGEPREIPPPPAEDR